MGRGSVRDHGGFTLLEVLIAFAILAVAVVSLIELTAQGLRLLKVSGDHQQAVQIADRLARDTQVNTEDVPSDTVIETGEEGNFTWERRVARLPLPEELEPKTPTPGKEIPGLYTVSVAVRWGRNHVVEVATLRAPAPVTAAAATPAADQQGQTPAQGGPTQGSPATPSGSQTGTGTGGGTSSSSGSTSTSTKGGTSSSTSRTTRVPTR
jgi:general secretion pathway protein I